MEVSNASLVKYDNIEIVSCLDDLSEELVINIFSFLSIDELINCSLVHKKWERCSGDKVLWKLFVEVLKLLPVEFKDPEEINYRIATIEKINILIY